MSRQLLLFYGIVPNRNVKNIVKNYINDIHFFLIDIFQKLRISSFYSRNSSLIRKDQIIFCGIFCTVLHIFIFAARSLYLYDNVLLVGIPECRVLMVKSYEHWSCCCKKQIGSDNRWYVLEKPLYFQIYCRKLTTPILGLEFGKKIWKVQKYQFEFTLESYESYFFFTTTMESSLWNDELWILIHKRLQTIYKYNTFINHFCSYGSFFIDIKS